MNILLINPFSSTAAVRQKNIASALTKRGHSVTLMLPKFDQYSSYTDVQVQVTANQKSTTDKVITVIHPFKFRLKNIELSNIIYIPSAII